MTETASTRGETALQGPEDTCVKLEAKLRHTCWMGPGAEASKAPVPGRAGGGGGVPEDMLALGVP